MTLNLQLPTEIERAVREKALAAGLDIETYVTNAVREKVAEDVAKPDGKRKREGFAERLDAWAKLHPVLDHPIDDSRESIYEGRGE